MKKLLNYQSHKNRSDWIQILNNRRTGHLHRNADHLYLKGLDTCDEVIILEFNTKGDPLKVNY